MSTLFSEHSLIVYASPWVSPKIDTHMDGIGMIYDRKIFYEKFKMPISKKKLLLFVMPVYFRQRETCKKEKNEQEHAHAVKPLKS